MSAVLRCARCDRRYRGRGEWNAEFRGGVIVFLLCAGCQTDEENAEAVINDATLDYRRLPDGRMFGQAKNGG